MSIAHHLQEIPFESARSALGIFMIQFNVGMYVAFVYVLWMCADMSVLF
jgi:hypothetical protein